MDASALKNMLEHSLVPGDPQYVGTPSHPGPSAVTWGKPSWLAFYNTAAHLYILDKLPFTLADINAAFP
jgi:hypothetical protein